MVCQPARPKSPPMQLIDNEQVRNLGNFDLLARQVVEGFIIGLHKSPFHGFSVEFAEHRVYNPGEPIRNVDWKVFARTNKMYTKRYEEETNLRCQIVVDTSSSMFFPEVTKTSEDHVNKIRFSALAAASLMNLLMKQRDAFGLSFFDESVGLHTRPKSSTTHYRLLLTYLQQLVDKPTRDVKTSAAASLHQIADSIHRRSLVIIFSDMFGEADKEEDLFSALQHLKHAKHEVVLFHTVDKKREIDFEFENRPYEFIDMESGERVKLQPNQVKEYYVEQVGAYKERLRLKCLQYNIDYVEADINDGFRTVLQAYMVKRNRMG